MSTDKAASAVVARNLDPPDPPDKSKTLLASLALFLAWLSNDVALAWIHERVPYESDPLPDVWFSLFAEYQPAIKITECLMLLSVAFTLSLIFLHRYRWVVARRTFLIAALCYFGRAVCITVTQVPVPSRRTYCAPRANETAGLRLIAERVARSFSGLGMDVYRRRVLCGDLVYSGHTTVLVLCYSVAERYCPSAYARVATFFAKAAALAGVICILTARKHYTLDVLLAYWIVSTVFRSYHYAIADIRRRSAASSTNYRGIRCDRDPFWYPILSYLESDVPCDFPNALATPSPCLRWKLFGRRKSGQEKINGLGNNKERALSTTESETFEA